MCLLIFLLMTGQPVKLDSIIFDAIDTCSNTHTHQLLFPHLISTLLIQAKVPQLASDPSFKPLPAFAYHHVISHKHPDIRMKMKSKQGNAQSKTTSLLTRLSEKVDRIETKVDKLTDMLTKLATFRGCHMDADAPEPSNPNLALTIYTGYHGESANDKTHDSDRTNAEIHSGETDDGHGSEDTGSTSTNESMGDVGASSSRMTVEDDSDLEYIPSEEDA